MTGSSRRLIPANIRPHEWETRQRKTSAGNYKDWTHTPITWHDLRHAFGTFLAANGFPAPTIEEWCGWADAKTMKRYLLGHPCEQRVGGRQVPYESVGTL
jgi:integrase